jgi:hypothetical protein
MVSWRVALSLLVLRDQIDALYPNRNKASDGTIGDAAHQATASDHNPDSDGIVRALDITHDPEHGCDIGVLSDALAAAQDSRVSYIIANRLITGPYLGWNWDEYIGDDPHENHLHISVVGTAHADKTYAWYLGNLQKEGNTMQLTGPDPWGNGNGNEQAAELRNGYHILANGYNPTEANANGVIARLDRIEKVLATLPSLQMPSIDYEALAKALFEQMAK